MRNLVLFLQKSCKITKSKRIIAYANIGDTSFALSEDGVMFSISETGDYEICFNLTMEIDGETGDPFLSSDDVLLPTLSYVIELDSLVFSSVGGKVFSYQYEESRVEIMGEMDEGITCMSWSPDEEVVVFCSGQNSIRIMTKEFETLQEMKLLEEKEQQQQLSEEKSKMLPQVSWRENSTSFVVTYQISESSNKFKVFTKEGDLVSKNENLKGVIGSVIDYRLDGRYISAPYYGSEKNEILHFEKNGLVHDRFDTTSEKRPIESILWNSDSTVLSLQFGSVIQFWTRRNWKWYLKYQHEIQSSSKVKNISCVKWDKEVPLKSHIFAYDEEKEEVIYESIQFRWDYEASNTKNGNLCTVISGNELKLTPLEVSNIPPPLCVTKVQISEEEKTSTNINYVCHHRVNREFLVRLSSGRVSIYDYSSYDRTKPPKFGISPKRIETIQLDLTDEKLTDSKVRLLHIFDPQYLIGVCHQSGNDRVVLIDRKTGKLSIFGVMDSRKEQNEEEIEGEDDDDDATEDIIKKKILIVSLSPDDENKKFFVQDHCGNVYEVRFDETKGRLGLVSRPTLSFPLVCVNGSCTIRLGIESKKRSEMMVGLSDSGCLYFGGEIIHSSCNSFYGLHPTLFFYTTFTNELKIIPKQYSFDEIMEFNLNEEESIEQDVPVRLKHRKLTRMERKRGRQRKKRIKGGIIDADDEMDIDSTRGKTDEESPLYYFRRQLERGAVLVCCGGTKIVLQLPRGNLEGIYPKLLALHDIERRIREVDESLPIPYGPILQACLKYKVDTNLIVDVHPKRWLEKDLKYFVESVSIKSTKFLNVFVASLREENVILSMYSKSLLKKPLSVLPEGTKVTQVLSSLRACLLQLSPQKYLRTILTSRITEYRVTGLKEHLSSALLDMKKIDPRNMDSLLPFFLRMLGKHAQDLFDLALSVYDLRLSQSIAKHSDMDPTEYAFIGNLIETEKQDRHYAYYKIDERLGQYSKALHQLSKCQSLSEVSEEDEEKVKKRDQFFEVEVMKFVKSHHLYKDAMSIPVFSESEKYLKKLLFSYGVYLEDHCQHRDREAAFVFMECDEKERARNCFVESGDYQLAFSMVEGLEESEIYDIGSRLVDKLKDLKRYNDASLVYREYMKEPEESVMLLCEFRLWSEAFRVAYIEGRSDLIETDVKPDLIDDADTLLQEIEENFGKLRKYVDRLKELRSEREAQLEELRREAMERDGLGGQDDFEMDMMRGRGAGDDSFSDAGSMMSGLSAYSGVTVFSTIGDKSSRSTVSRKKSKRTKLKKGSVFEEVNLVKRLETLIPLVSYQNQVKDVLGMLIFIKETEKARILQATFGKMIQHVIDHRQEIEREFAPPIIEHERIQDRIKPNITKYFGTQFWDWKIEFLEIESKSSNKE